MKLDPSSKPTPVVGLDLIRFAAALSVVWFHLAYWSWFSPNGTPGLITDGLVRFPDLAPLARCGWVGVEVFFVLSGFVIAFSAEGKSATAFAWTRFLRLYPAAWVCSLITLSFAVLLWRSTGSPYGLKEMPLRFLHSAVIWPTGPWVDGVYWTLGIEMVFYGLVFCLLSAGRFDKLPWLLIALGAISSTYIFTQNVQNNRIAELMMLRHGCFFALGGFLWLRTRQKLHPLYLIACAIFTVASVLEILAKAPGFGDDGQIAVVVFLLAVGAMILSSEFNAQITRALPAGSPAVIRQIGLATYPLYLLHDVSGAAIMRWLVLAGLPQHAALGCAVLAAAGLSFFVAGKLEPVARSWVRKVAASVGDGRRAERLGG